MQFLSEVKSVQRLAYEAAVSTRKKLKIGMTEKEACRLMEDFFHQRNHRLFFHRPFAWFGDRTNFTGFKRPSAPKAGQLLPHLGTEFMPTDRRLESGMAVTLDVAPSVNGIAVDIGYSFGFEEGPEITRARRDLLLIRDEILSAAQNKLPIKEIYRLVERKIITLGYRNCHDLYPLGVLGHKIGKLPLLKFPKISIMGFHPQAYLYLLKEISRGSAIMTEDENRPMSPGFWAIEPHIGGKEFGVKFEEIMVITESGEAYWLDNDLPHITELNS